GDVMKGWTFPGRTISSEGAFCLGETTETAGRAARAVSAFSVVRALRRNQMPDAKRVATTTNAIARTGQALRGRFPRGVSLLGPEGPPLCPFSSAGGNMVTPHAS